MDLGTFEVEKDVKCVILIFFPIPCGRTKFCHSKISPVWTKMFAVGAVFNIFQRFKKLFEGGKHTFHPLKV